MGYIHQSHVILTASMRSRLFRILFYKRNNSSIDTQQVHVRPEMRIHVSLVQRSTTFFLNVIPKIYYQKMDSNLPFIHYLNVTFIVFTGPDFPITQATCRHLKTRMANACDMCHLSYPDDIYHLLITELSSDTTSRSFLAHRAPDSTNSKNVYTHIKVICCLCVDIPIGDCECLRLGQNLGQLHFTISDSGQVTQFF